jgi:FixJ family two-component response regulator
VASRSLIPTITVVDDDEAVRDSMRELLLSHDFDVVTYPSATRFLSEGDKATSNTDCLVLDLHMPGMDGLELLELLWKRRVHLPVIIVTGRSDSALKARAKTARAVIMLDKPVSEDSLLAAINAALDQSSRGKDPMEMKCIRLELARDKDHPNGDPLHAYVFRAPLDASGHLDDKHWPEVRNMCVVRRIEDGSEVEAGLLQRAGNGRWVFSYAPGKDDDEPIFRLSKHTFLPGEYVSVTEHDGVERTFRVASVKEWHPNSSH